MPNLRKNKKKKIILGLTGSFGSGKTTVAQCFKSLGACVLDADRVAHQYLLRGTPTYRRIVRLFGKRILGCQGRIDRAELGRIVFNDEDLLLKLNAIVHPAVKESMRRAIGACRARVVVLDVPLLIEARLQAMADRVAVVTAPRQAQIERIQKKRGLSKKEILARIRSQLPLREKVRAADFIIDNSASKKETKRQVKEIWKKLEEMWKSLTSEN
ncbi:MAG: dephospho-CoA kinase [Candidatus Omnitrophica bacterium]|nr:dephospho-CoA kinase [Candidatus Omnitrophota bacterium]